MFLRLRDGDTRAQTSPLCLEYVNGDGSIIRSFHAAGRGLSLGGATAEIYQQGRPTAWRSKESLRGKLTQTTSIVDNPSSRKAALSQHVTPNTATSTTP